MRPGTRIATALPPMRVATTEQGPDHETIEAVAQARARLGRIAGRDLLRRRGGWVLGAGAALAACRPLVLRIADEAPRWTAVGRSLALFAAGSALSVVGLLWAGRRRGPSEIGAARAIDEALGSPEVVASGLAFARDGREDPPALLARRRAATAAAGLRVEASFPLPSLRPTARRAAGFALGAALAIAVGSFDRGLVQALVAPPTAQEREAAADLDAAAQALASLAEVKGPERPRDPPTAGRERGEDRGGKRGSAVADLAREAASAARRGDRRGALSKLEDVRSAGARQASRAEGMGAALRKIAEALQPAAGGAKAATPGSSPQASAEESMRLLAQKVRSGAGGAGSGEAAEDRVLERLDRASEEARRAAAEGGSPGASEAARDLGRAAEALRRGDRAAAAEALEQAAARAAEMERQRAAAMTEAMAVAEMLERSGELERALQMALLGREDAAGKGEGQGAAGNPRGGAQGKGDNGSGAGALRAAILARLAALGATASDGDPGTGSGPHIPDRHRAKREALAPSGSLRAPSQVGEGERAVQAIHGLGRGGEGPAAYREVFPSYDAAAEEGMADERVPASRRDAVRRYFQSIRPDQM